jgi:hypothetical protein
VALRACCEAIKTVKKFVKKLGAEVVSLGFPKLQLPAVQAWAIGQGLVVTDEPGLWWSIRTWNI